MIRKFKSSDLEAVRRITVEAFEGVAADQNIERAFGAVSGRTWQ